MQMYSNIQKLNRDAGSTFNFRKRTRSSAASSCRHLREKEIATQSSFESKQGKITIISCTSVFYPFLSYLPRSLVSPYLSCLHSLSYLYCLVCLQIPPHHHHSSLVSSPYSLYKIILTQCSLSRCTVIFHRHILATPCQIEHWLRQIGSKVGWWDGSQDGSADGWRCVSATSCAHLLSSTSSTCVSEADPTPSLLLLVSLTPLRLWHYSQFLGRFFCNFAGLIIPPGTEHVFYPW